jgi:hypothetical protein
MSECQTMHLWSGKTPPKLRAQKRIEFLGTLKDRTNDQTVKKECEENLKRWIEPPFS